MRAVVSGSGGMIGWALVDRLLADGYEVRATDILPLDEWQKVNPDAENWGNFDMSRPELAAKAVKGCDRVYSLAFKMGGIGFIEKNPFDCIESSSIMLHTLRAAMDEGVERFFMSGSACFVAGTPVNTNRGVIPIEDVRVGDYVTTETGESRRVTELHNRTYQGDMVSLSVKGNRQAVRCTADHRILTKNGWERADSLGPGDYVFVPKPDLEGPSLTFDFQKDQFKLFGEELIRTGERPYKLAEKYPGITQSMAYKIAKGYRPFRMAEPMNVFSVAQTSELGEIVGMYLGNGWQESGTRVVWAFNSDSKGNQKFERLIGLLETVFGIEPQFISRYKMHGQSGQKIHVTSRELVKFFDQFYLPGLPHGAKTKRIGNMVIGPLEWREGLIRGMWATDGCHATYSKNVDRFTYSTISPTLANDLRSLLLSVGVLTSVQHRLPLPIIQGRKVNVSPAQSIYPLGESNGRLAKILGTVENIVNRGSSSSYETENGFWIQVGSVSVDKGWCQVYNLEVDGIHSYTAGFIAVHNCAYARKHQLNPDVPALAEWMAWPAEPEFGYGTAKLFDEECCKAAYQQYGLETRIARFHNIYSGGPTTWTGGKEKAPAAICRKVAEADVSGSNHVEIWGDGSATRSFCWINDCIEGVVRLTDSKVREPVNIGSDEMVSINELVDIVEDVAYGERRVVRSHNMDGAQGVRGRNSDNTLIRELLGWAPETPLRDGLAILYPWVYDRVHE